MASKIPTLPQQAPGASLNLKQRQFCQMMVRTTSLSDDDLSRLLGVPDTSIRLWRKNKHCKAYIEALTEEVVSDREFMERAKQTTYRLYEKQAVELESRFDEPDMEHYKGLPDAAARQAYLDRFARMASYKDTVRAFEAINKSTRLMMPTEIESETVMSFQDMTEKIRSNYELTVQRRADFEKRLLRGEVEKQSNPIGELFDYKKQMARRAEGRQQVLDRQKLGMPDAIIDSDEDSTEDLMEVTIKTKTTTRGPK
jgi:hypothetical protein